MRKIYLFLLIMVASTTGAQIIHVPANYPTIQQGINAAQPGDTILVADGTYYEQVNITAKKPLLVASNFIMDGDSTHLVNTIIDGSTLQGGNRTVVTFTNVDSTAILAGFTIQKGKGTYSGGVLSGGGIRLVSSGAKIVHNRIINNVVDGGPPPFGQNCNTLGAAISSLSYSQWIVIADNLIKDNICKSNLQYALGAGGYVRSNVRFASNVVTGNLCKTWGTAYAEGGGFCIDGTTNTSALITGNNIYNNQTQAQGYACGGGLITVRSKNYISNNQFIDNISMGQICDGAGITLALCTASSTFENNLFQGNKSDVGSALTIDLTTSDTMYIKNNTFIENEGDNGGALYSKDGILIIENNVFNKNSATVYGGAMSINKSGVETNNVRIINNTFSGNTGGVYGGAIMTQRCNPYLLNNIFWDNTAPTAGDIKIMAGNASVAYSNIDPDKIQGAVNLLDGLILQNPLFCDTTCLTVFPNSPCLNQGAEYYVFEGSNIVYATSHDIVYKQRPINGTYDMGAYEIDTTQSGVKYLEAFKLTIFPNPSNNFINCRYSLRKDSRVALHFYDILGTIKYSREFRQSAGEHTVPVNLEGLTKGVYLLKLQVNDQVVTRKVIKN